MRIPANLAYVVGALLLAAFAAPALAAGKLVIEQGWIRLAPPGAMMLAGYATLRNVGDEPLTVTGADSADFASVSLHESIAEDGVERMRALGHVSIAPGASVEFAPGSKHFMLMRPVRELKLGETVKIHVSTGVSTGTTAEFVVRDPTP